MNNKSFITDFLNNQYRTDKKNSNLFYENFILYSYGYHYPLCIKLKDNHFIINNSGYSMTTSRHTNEIIKQITSNNSLNMKSFENQNIKKQYNNIVFMNTEQMKKIINYIKYKNNDNSINIYDIGLIEIEN